jgi:hypothetical protein
MIFRAICFAALLFVHGLFVPGLARAEPLPANAVFSP